MNIEELESRRLYSITIAQGYPGFYSVDSDNAQDWINIDVNGTTLTVNGSVAATNVADVSSKLNGGNDVLIFTSNNTHVGISVDGGLGADYVEVHSPGGAGVWGGDGNDNIQMYAGYRYEAYGQGGQDQIWLYGQCDESLVEGDQNGDLIDASGSTGYHQVLGGGDGSDTIKGGSQDDQIYGDAGEDYIYGNGGDDTIYIHDGGMDHVDGGSGYDVVYCDSILIEDPNMPGVENAFPS